MSNLLEYKGYSGTVEFQAEDECFCGQVLHINDLIMYSGTSVDEVKAMFHEAVDEYLEDCLEEGVDPDKPYTGSLNCRIGKDLHKLCVSESKSKSISINAVIKDALELKFRGLENVVHNHTHSHFSVIPNPEDNYNQTFDAEFAAEAKVKKETDVLWN